MVSLRRIQVFDLQPAPFREARGAHQRPCSRWVKREDVARSAVDVNRNGFWRLVVIERGKKRRSGWTGIPEVHDFLLVDCHIEGVPDEDVIEWPIPCIHHQVLVRYSRVRMEIRRSFEKPDVKRRE